MGTSVVTEAQGDAEELLAEASGSDRGGAEMAATRKELVADGANGATVLWGLLVVNGGSKTGLLLGGGACARGWRLGDA
jgi:hypothetical protein